MVHAVLQLSKYQTVLSFDEFTQGWRPEEFITKKGVMKMAYKRYLARCEVFKRDNFSCQNMRCVGGFPITLHHIIFREHGGSDHAQNGITLCTDCHSRFHRDHMKLYIGFRMDLPHSIFENHMDNKNIVIMKSI